jgi:hypothetical protein
MPIMLIIKLRREIKNVQQKEISLSYNTPSQKISNLILVARQSTQRKIC